MGSAIPFKGNPPKIDEPPQHTGEPPQFQPIHKEKTDPDTLYFNRICYSMWSFHLHSMVKIQPFSPVFSLEGTTAKAFYRLSLWSFKEKSINHFL